MRAFSALLAALLVATCSPTVPSEPSQAAPPGPTAEPPVAWAPAVDAVVEAFDEHAVVAIGEIHGSRPIHVFLRELVGDPRLVGVLQDVAVEFGSARHQATIDRFVLGEEVLEADLTLVWSDTTQRSGVWNSPIYREFFERIRELNVDRSPPERIRVLLGDPPIEWDSITAPANATRRIRDASTTGSSSAMRISPMWCAQHHSRMADASW
jgi:hypothetical protein